MTVLTDKPEVNRFNAALLVEELTEIYSTPTPKGLREAKKSNWYWLIGCLFTIVGVQYLYPEPKLESYSSMTYYKLWYKRNIPNLR